MRIIRFGVCAVASLVSAPAFSDPPIMFGQAVPGQSIEETVASMPQARWTKFRDGKSGPVIGALGSDAVEFDDWRWNLRLGKTFRLDSNEFSYSFEVNRSRRFERESECEATTSRTIAALEPSLGAYRPGGWLDVHPEWSDMETRAGTAREVNAGAQSRVRVYVRDKTQYVFGIQDVQMGAATRAFVIGINTPDPINGQVGYHCSISIQFKTPAQLQSPAGQPSAPPR